MLLTLVTLASAAAPPPIINGEEADETLYPMTGGLLLSAYIDMGSYGAQQYDALICSSTLIAPDVVLVAAHCLDPEVLTYGYGTVSDEAFRWTRQADLTDYDGTKKVKAWPDDAVQAWDWTFNDKFDINKLGYGIAENFDVGLVFLDTPVTDVDPAVLVTEEEASQIEEGDDVVIVGWGQQEATSGYQQPDPGTYAIKMWGQSVIGEIGEPEFQVGPDKSDPRKCHGDSGGPTFMDVETDSPEVMRQIGITSHSYDDTDCAKKGGVDTRVDHYLAWIDKEMRSRCEDGSRVWCDEPGILPPPVPPEPEDTGSADGADTGGTDGDPLGCGCNGAPTPAGALLALVPAALLMRRRHAGRPA